MSCRSTIVNAMGYESLRFGFQPGVMLIMDAVSENNGSFCDI